MGKEMTANTGQGDINNNNGETEDSNNGETEHLYAFIPIVLICEKDEFNTDGA